MTDKESQGKSGKFPGNGEGPSKGKGIPWSDDEDVEEKNDWKDLQQLAQGQLGMKVTDSQGNVKEHQRYARVKGEGSMAAIKRAKGTSKQAAGDDEVVWKMKRRDKIPGLNKKPDTKGEK